MLPFVVVLVDVGGSSQESVNLLKQQVDLQAYPGYIGPDLLADASPKRDEALLRG
uniref:Uncharacterized protein n=1 Tax=Helianthus annuus TaxID=4232 RepID=A0A251UQE9_HELAN